MKRHNYRVIPVNPNETSVLGEVAYTSLASVPEPIDLVDIFRRSEAVGQVVDDAIAQVLAVTRLEQQLVQAVGF